MFNRNMLMSHHLTDFKTINRLHLDEFFLNLHYKISLRHKYSNGPLNNTELNCMGLLIQRFFFSNSKYYSTAQFLVG